MPDRMLRDGLLLSEAFNCKLSLEQQLFFVRLLLVVDDFGCMDGRLGVLTTRCWPFMNLHAEEAEEASDMLHKLHLAGLIVRYTNAGKPFIAIQQWREGLRLNRLYPAPPVNVDMPFGVRGKYGKEVGWHNPEGWDHASVLIGIDGHPITPQPPEWRREDGTPINDSNLPQKERRARREKTLLVTGDAASNVQHVTGSPATGSTIHAERSKEVRTEGIKDGGGGGGEGKNAVTGSTLQAASNSPANGELIDFNGSEFTNLSEAQRLRWQDMFAQLAIPDEVDRAAAWLAGHAGEREAIRVQGEGFHGFIVRWLLKSARGTQGTYKGSH